MATVTTNDQNYADIAAAIRAKNETTEQYLPSQMAAAITALATGEEGMQVASGKVTYTSAAVQTLDTGLSEVTYFLMYSDSHGDSAGTGTELIMYDGNRNRYWASAKTSSSSSFRSWYNSYGAFTKSGGVVSLGSLSATALQMQRNVTLYWIAIGH